MRTAIIMSALLAIVTHGPALATSSEPRTAAVRVGDLDLASAEGRKILRQRTGRALERVCGAYTDPNPYEQDRVTACRTVAKASINQQLAARNGATMLAAR